MTFQIPIDSLNEVIEYLEEDRHTLYSCLLVNRLWCEISVRILWRNIWDFERQSQLFGMESILDTLFTFLPNESKEFLHENKIFISIPISKQSLFNYPSFCKALSIYGISKIVEIVLTCKPTINSSILKNRNLIINEFTKMFANQIFSLKKLSYYHHCSPIDFSFPYFPGVRDLLELHCCSCLPSDIFYQLSQLCHNLQSMSISFCNDITSNEFKELVSFQNNLKNLKLSFDMTVSSCADIIPTLKKHSDTITKLHLYIFTKNLSSCSFINSFVNLQEFIFSSFRRCFFDDFEPFQYINFSKLQTLKIPHFCPNSEDIIKFLKNNGKNLKKLYVNKSCGDLSLFIPHICPNLKSLFLLFHKNELDILKTILINCQSLESIKVKCGKNLFEEYLSEKEVLEIVANHSPNNFCELKIYIVSDSDISLDDLDSFFFSWKNRVPKKLLSLIIIKNKNLYRSLDHYKENREIIKKYQNLGIIKFKTIDRDEATREEEESYNYY
ncbi:hypothetical protein RclHR1_02990001 [Rhizophagus clarus]|uniref:F-box domain-containing protein n=1 Tax=Rhizophagus clarus TaxID=94130 RepID=A0A2Z6R5P3_9GLOM|nr:hypothetical protein RclHR1_02990001 [Rhizophagus clarus]GES88164.1 hypothetical protein GLOIN_2v1784405 [Rhizophagus clarus]